MDDATYKKMWIGLKIKLRKEADELIEMCFVAKEWEDAYLSISNFLRYMHQEESLYQEIDDAITKVLK